MNSGDSSLAQLKDKNGYTASDHAAMGKTPRYITVHVCVEECQLVEHLPRTQNVTYQI